MGVEHVIIPVEHGFARILQALEEAGFYLVQHVEAHEYVAGYGNRIRVKYTAKWGVQIAGMIFQTRSSIACHYICKWLDRNK